MKLRALVILSAFISFAVSFSARAIVGGRDSAASDALFASIPRLEIQINGESGICSGVLVSRTQVLTAQHCVAGQVTRVIFELNGKSLPYSVARITPMPRAAGDCSPLPGAPPELDACGENDLAVLQLSTEVDPALVPLPIGAGSTLGRPITIAGWGDRDETEGDAAKNGSGVLRIVDDLKLSDRNGGLLIYVDALGRGAASGDSGGPWLSKDAAGKWQIEGIVSTNLTSYYRWNGTGVPPRNGTSADLNFAAAQSFLRSLKL